ncbi:105_t:CDS:2, partial [Funneliformis geosporum]
MSKLNTALRGLGLPEMDIEPVIEGLRAGTITPNYFVGAVEEGGWLHKAVKVIKGGFKAVSHLVDRVKDALVDVSLSGINTRIGDLKGELDGTNEKLDKQGKAMSDGFNKLSGQLQGTKSELEGKLSAQGTQIGNLQSQTNRLDSALSNLSQAHSEFKEEVSQQFEEVNERLDTTEVKVTKNA